MMAQRIARVGTVRFDAVAHAGQRRHEVCVELRRGVRSDEHAVLLRELRDAQRLAEAGRARRIELEIPDRAAFDEVADGVAMDLPLAVGKRDARVRRKLHVVARLQIPVQRLFEPRDVVGLDAARKPNAVVEVVRGVHVEHEQRLTADRFAHAAPPARSPLRALNPPVLSLTPR